MTETVHSINRLTVAPEAATATRHLPLNTDRAQRGDHYGNAFTLPAGLTPAQGAALSGNYFLFCNAAPGTELATHANQTAYDQNLPVAVWRNSSSSRIMIPDWILLKAETVLASADELLWTLAASETDDYSSGGTVLTAKNALIGSDETAHGLTYFGDPQVTDVAKIILGTGMISDVVPVIDSNFIFRFGMPGESSYISGAATAAHTVRNLPAVALKPGATCALYIYGNAGSATPTYDVCGANYEF